MLIRFDSLGDFARRAGAVLSPSWSSGSWYGDISHARAGELALSGDDSLVPQAETLLEQLDAAIDITHSTWQPSVYGAYPIVPEFLAGASPDYMRRRQVCSDDVSPITIYVSTTCSASLEADAMLKRGVAILALVLKLQAMRPVKLILLAETHGRSNGECLQAIEINSQPLDLATICFALTHVGFARHLTYSLARELDGFNGSWPNQYGDGGARWEAHIRPILDMQPQDLYIGAARSWDEAITNPVPWVNAQIEHFRNLNEREN